MEEPKSDVIDPIWRGWVGLYLAGVAPWLERIGATATTTHGPVNDCLSGARPAAVAATTTYLCRCVTSAVYLVS